MTARQLRAQAQQQWTQVQAEQPLWQWRLRNPRDLVAGRAFGHATVERDNGALRIISHDGTPFELGLPIAWALDLRAWPILDVQWQSSSPVSLNLIWQGSQTPACLAPAPHALAPTTNSLRIDLRRLSWTGIDKAACAMPGIARMFRLRFQLPRGASLRIRSAALWNAKPIPRPQDITIDLPQNPTPEDIRRATERVQGWPMPLLRLPEGLSAQAMLALRDLLRTRWPAALIVPAHAMPQATPAASVPPAIRWMGCILYLLILLGLVLRPTPGHLRPWSEIAGCLLGPLWLIMGLHYYGGPRPAPPEWLAFAGGLAYALVLDRRFLPRLWRCPKASSYWLWPLATLPVAMLLILFYGHPWRPLSPGHVLAYFGWSCVQQWLMLRVLQPRFEQILQRPAWAIVAVALVFALLHAPNGRLMQLCFVGELWWAYCFLRSRSVLPIALAHALCALVVESALAGGPLLRSLEVSARFFLYKS